MSCKSCNLTTNNLYMNGKYCYLCNIIFNTQYFNIKNIIVCSSNLSQLDIIKLTRDYIQKNNKIPSPSEIDKDCKITSNVNHYILSIIISKSDNFDNYKVFITDIDISKVKVLKFFDKIKSNKNKYDIQRIGLTEDEYKIYKSEMEKYNVDSNYKLIDLYK